MELEVSMLQFLENELLRHFLGRPRPPLAFGQLTPPHNRRIEHTADSSWNILGIREGGRHVARIADRILEKKFQ